MHLCGSREKKRVSGPKGPSSRSQGRKKKRAKKKGKERREAPCPSGGEKRGRGKSPERDGPPLYHSSWEKKPGVPGEKGKGRREVGLAPDLDLAARKEGERRWEQRMTLYS